MSANGNGHYWSKFTWRDWASDEALRMCSMAAQGFWMRLLCMAHGADPIGHVLVNGRQPTTRQLAALTGANERDVTGYLHELETLGVFSRTDDGTVYCRRMVRDAAQSEAGREAVSKRWGKKPTHPNGEDPNTPPNRDGSSGATDYPTTKSTESESELERGPPKSPRRRGDLPPTKLSVTDQIRRDWNLGTFLAPDIRDDDQAPGRRLMS